MATLVRFDGNSVRRVGRKKESANEQESGQNGEANEREQRKMFNHKPLIYCSIYYLINIIFFPNQLIHLLVVVVNGVSVLLMIIFCTLSFYFSICFLVLLLLCFVQYHLLIPYTNTITNTNIYVRFNMKFIKNLPQQLFKRSQI